MWRNVANAIGFQLVWICCVANAERGALWAGVVAAVSFGLVTLAFGRKPREDIVAVLLTLPLGLALDACFAASGWLRYAHGGDMMVPIWIGALWLGFAFTLNHSFAFLRERIGLAAVLGLVFAPLSYLAAQRLGAVEFVGARSTVLPMLAVAWGLLLPLFFALLRFASAAPRRQGHPA